MNVYNASIHVSIFQNFVCHICHFRDLTKAVKCNLTVNAFIAFRVRFLCQLVSINPGAMALTRICFGSSSFTRDLVRK